MGSGAGLAASSQPQAGQPKAKSSAFPTWPQRGHLTEEKKRPQRGQSFASLPTSAPQRSQK
jgi:hypothetical protein